MRTSRSALLLTALMSACIPGPMDRQRYEAWLADPGNGMVKVSDREGVRFQLEYEPLEKIAHRETDAPTESMIGAIVARKKGAHHFKLRMRSLSSNDLLGVSHGTAEDYNKRLFYFDSMVQDDLLLVIGTDTLPCALAHLERTYGASPYNDLLISFIDDRDEATPADLHFIYKDQAFGAGPVEFVIHKDDLSRLPTLKHS